MTARSLEQRKRDALDKLDHDIDVWMATSSGDGRPYLVPLSLAWDGRRVIVTVEDGSRTARNAAASGLARLALGNSRDVVMIDARVESIPAEAIDEPTAELFVQRAGWDPRPLGGYAFLVMHPRRVQVWKEVDEIEGRTVMRDGRWLA